MSKIEVRYCSRTKFGNTRRIAEAIAEGAGTKAISIDDEPKLTGKADILFLGGAPYANIMAPELREYAEDLDPAMVQEEAWIFPGMTFLVETDAGKPEIRRTDAGMEIVYYVPENSPGLEFRLRLQTS